MQALIDSFDVPAADVADEIENNGAACLSAVLTESWLCAAQECVQSYLPINGRDEVFIEHPAADKHAFVHRLVIDPRLEALLESVASAGFPNLRAGNQDIQCSIRILVGPGEHRKPLWFHYDRSVVTMVVPVVIPNVGSRISGELILCPNRRPYRRFVMANIIEKLVSQNDLYRRQFARRLYDTGTKVIALQPGNAYLFWGYRTYHATFPCARDALRVTLVLHYGNVHGTSRVLAGAQWFYGGIRNLRRKLPGARIGQVAER
jgi:hypothetical protein